jgi:hypothetical protein
MVCRTYFNIKSSWVWMFWIFNLSFDILDTVLATFPNIGQIFAQFSGHSAENGRVNESFYRFNLIKFKPIFVRRTNRGARIS